MAINFDFEAIETTEFGVAYKDRREEFFYLVPVDDEVQNALQEMAVATRDAMTALAEEPVQYEASEKHDRLEYLQLPLDDDLMARLRLLHGANNLELNAVALEVPENIFFYFAKMRDGEDQPLTALRRASRFKGVLKKRLIRLVTNTLRLVEDDVFRLDDDFDLLIDSDNVHVLRPHSFEIVGELQPAIMNAVPKNVRILERHLPYVDFSGIEAYAGGHPRAARYLASIRAQEIQDVSRRLLSECCKENGVELERAGRKIIVSEGHIMGFLEILDRRRYAVNFTGEPELFRAASRRKVQ